MFQASRERTYLRVYIRHVIAPAYLPACLTLPGWRPREKDPSKVLAKKIACLSLSNARCESRDFTKKFFPRELYILRIEIHLEKARFCPN